jgi:hypothetical protein
VGAGLTSQFVPPLAAGTEEQRRAYAYAYGTKSNQRTAT